VRLPLRWGGLRWRAGGPRRFPGRRWADGL